MAGRRAAAKPAVVEAPVEETVAEPVVESTEEVATTEGQDPAEAQAKADATADEAAQAPAAPKEPKPEQVVDIEPFLVALNAGLEKKDPSTGTLDVATQSDILKSYRSLANVKSKTAARKHVQDGMAEAVSEGDIATARAYMALSKELSSAGSAKADKGPKEPKTPKAPVDPTLAFVDTAVRLKLAMNIHGQSVNENIRPEWKDEVNAKFEELSKQLDTWATYLDSEDENLDAPEVDPLVVAAFKTAAGRASGKVKVAKAASTTTGDGVRRSIGKHLEEAFAGVEVGGFLSVAQIRAFQSKEYTAEDGTAIPVSAGAITARLFPKDAEGTIKPCTVPGIQGDEDESGHKGARKVA